MVVTGSKLVFTIVGTFMVCKSNKHVHAANAVFCSLCFFSFTFFLKYSISLRVIPCFIVQRNDVDEEVFMMEEALTGSFKKYLVNDGNATKNGLETSDGKVCLAFAHWTLQYTGEALLVTDLQGNVIRPRRLFQSNNTMHLFRLS